MSTVGPALSIPAILSMPVSPGRIVTITNRELERPQKGEFCARLKSRIIKRLTPVLQPNNGVHLPILRVREKTRPFQLPKDCVLWAVQGSATVVAPGQRCAIRFAEDLSLEAGLAVLGPGPFRRLSCQVALLLPTQESGPFVDGPATPRVNIKAGEIDYMFLFHQDRESPPALPHRIAIRGSGTIVDLHIDTIDFAITRLGNVSTGREMYIEEWLREEIDQTLWRTAPAELNQALDAVWRVHGSFRIDAGHVWDHLSKAARSSVFGLQRIRLI
ncbi:MAG TPA: hypothetical protein VF020_18620 [Chthoniobacterales bacterium]